MTSRGRGRDLEMAMPVKLGDLIEGFEREVEVTRTESCASCKGTGAEGGTALETCKTCGGSGQVRNVRRSGYTQVVTIGECPMCRGAGQKILKTCPTCGGAGRQRVPRHLRIRVPPGLEEGTMLRLSGEGERGRGGRSGDLYVHVVVEPSPFRREGRDLYSEITVDLPQALLGDSVRIQTLNGHADLTVPAGTQPESTLRLRGEGLPPPGGGSRGDLFVTVHVRLPERLTSTQRDAVRLHFPPSPGSAGTSGGAEREKGGTGFFGRRRG